MKKVRIRRIMFLMILHKYVSLLKHDCFEIETICLQVHFNASGL